MTIKVTCSKCAKTYEVSDKFGGMTGPCPKCNAQIRVPNLSENFVVQYQKNWFDEQDEQMAKSAAVRKTSSSTRGTSMSNTWVKLGVYFIGLPYGMGIAWCWLFAYQSEWDDDLVYLALAVTFGSLVVAFLVSLVAHIADRLTDIQALLENRK